MTGLRDLPWLWLGLPEVYVSLPQRRDWQPLDRVAGSAGPYRVPASGGGDWPILGISTRLGLPGSAALSDLQAAVLARILASVVRLAPGPVQMFAPPAQCRGLIALAQRVEPRPAGVVLDAVLLGRAPAVSAAHAAPTAYVLDWRTPRRQTPYGLDPRARPDGGLPTPALINAADFREGRLEPLSYFLQGALQPAHFALEPAGTQSAQGRRPPGLALVWAWGRGEVLWQWALRPQARPAGAGCQVRLAPPCHCIVAGPRGDCESLPLELPGMEWQAAPPPGTAQ